MNGSHRPIVQMFNRLCVRSKVYNPHMMEYDHEEVVRPDSDERSYQLLLEAMRRHGDVDLPANIPLTVKHTRLSSSLVCSGFTLTTL
jgi:hypothetical protein